ncbi:type II toxin-antitoxin system RelE/ParE family toxin [Sphingomonas psychrolutea]|uniref:type II toxin-antitoxin system RelE/ParE family toxin n=1 Tax=Sphingomonas psychrolutea TaxID=1259676 RepID=UPI001E5F7F73|nr:type II toxin-antitoxin system RelE/ParE family toxin [Sphingomonas psychrolutea]
MPHMRGVQLIIETNTYLADAKAAGMSEEECDDVKTAIATNPLRGTPIAGGARKVRVAGRGKGKSGGYRVVYFFGGGDIPIFLLTVFGKGEKDNLTKAEQNALAGVGDRLRASFTKK